MSYKTIFVKVASEAFYMSMPYWQVGTASVSHCKGRKFKFNQLLTRKIVCNI